MNYTIPEIKMFTKLSLLTAENSIPTIKKSTEGRGL